MRLCLCLHIKPSSPTQSERVMAESSPRVAKTNGLKRRRGNECWQKAQSFHNLVQLFGVAVSFKIYINLELELPRKNFQRLLTTPAPPSVIIVSAFVWG